MVDGWRWRQHGQSWLEVRLCVYLNGEQGSIAQRLSAKGLIRTTDDFGCTCFEERQNQ